MFCVKVKVACYVCLSTETSETRHASTAVHQQQCSRTESIRWSISWSCLHDVHVVKMTNRGGRKHYTFKILSACLSVVIQCSTVTSMALLSWHTGHCLMVNSTKITVKNLDNNNNLRLINYKLTERSMFSSTVWTDIHRLLQELNLTARQPCPNHHVIHPITTSAAA